MARIRICKIPGCRNGGQMTRGWCQSHYSRWLKYGDPNHGGPIPPKIDRIQYMRDHMWEDCPKWPFSRTSAGYGNVVFEGENRYVHRLVCEIAHGPPPTSDHEAAHSCGKGHQGCFGANCLEWKTSAENKEDQLRHGTRCRGSKSGRSKLTEGEVLEIRRSALKSQRSLAQYYGVTHQTIGNILSRKSWFWLD